MVEVKEKTMTEFDPKTGLKFFTEEYLKQAAKVLGKKGGQSKSPAKVEAARKNASLGGEKGGRPKKEKK
jgi:hypothetical protein